MLILKAIRTSEKKERLRFSVILKFYFWTLFVMSIFLIIHATTVLVIWRDDLKLPLLPLFWSGTPDGNFMTVIPITTLALTLDKCLILLLKGKYNYYWTAILFRASVLISTLLAVGNFLTSLFLRRSEKPNDCVAYGCTLESAAVLTYTYTRTAEAVVSTIVGITFIVITLWLKKKKLYIRTKAKIIAEAVVFRAVIFGIICDLVPHMADTILVSTTGETLFKYVGPYSRMLMATDLLLNSLMNWMVFQQARKKKIPVVQIMTTTLSKSN